MKGVPLLGLYGPAAASFFLCLLAMFALRPLAVAVDLIDRPDGGRKVHKGEVPIVGGIAMFIGVVLGVGLVPLLSAESGAAFLAASALLVTIGLLDDRFDLSPWTRLPAQIAAAVVLMFGSQAFVTSIGSPLGAEVIGFGGVWSYVATVLVTIAAINAFNMLDGMDGLAGAMAIIALAALAYLGSTGGLPVAAGTSLVVIGAVAAFLMFNLPARFNRQKRCFMGDAGSTLLGFAVAWLCIDVSQGQARAASPVTMLWIVALPLYELVWSTIRRIVRGVSPFRPDDKHFHHMVLKAGFGVRGAFALFVTIGGALAIIGVTADRMGASDSMSFAMLIVAGVLVTRLMYRADIVWNLVPLPLRRLTPVDVPKPAKAKA
jgi:UDP-GlcNAc:undecaprenyl-phosphate/decaprenyl-phosphate GlcNAc-1-phosphate transferase